MTTYLLDANVLIALTVAEHEHHERATRWAAGISQFAVCPVVEGALLRFFVRMGETSDAASGVLRAVRIHPNCEFWPDSASYLDADLTRVRGYRQLTDAYLASRALAKGALLATLDEGLKHAMPEAVCLLPR